MKKYRVGYNGLRILTFEIPSEFAGKKLLHYLRGELKFSSHMVTVLKHTPDGICCNGKPMRTIDRLHAGDILRVQIPSSGSMPEPEDVALDILYVDDDILAINKPPGMAMHPTHNHRSGTLANAVAGYLLREGRQGAFRAIGRLDKGTSGVVLCALHPHAAYRLSGWQPTRKRHAMLPAEKPVQKEYLAVAGGQFFGSGTINQPIIRPDPHKTLRACADKGLHAVTHWTALRNFPEENCTLLRLRLETGRTHQIRVHFASLGTPLLGDDMYGSKRLDVTRPLLHCHQCSFLHPVTAQQMRIMAPYPPDFAPYLD